MTTAMLIFGVLSVIAGCGVILSRKPLNSALWLVVTLFLVAVHFALLDAHFLAVIQILVYAGAIMVLVIFVIMLLGINELPLPKSGNPGRVVASLLTGLFVAILVLAVQSGVRMTDFVARGVPEESLPEKFGTTEMVGEALFLRFAYPFEIASLLLTAAIIGAVVLALEPKRPLKRGRGLSAMHRTSDAD